MGTWSGEEGVPAELQGTVTVMPGTPPVQGAREWHEVRRAWHRQVHAGRHEAAADHGVGEGSSGARQPRDSARPVRTPPIARTACRVGEFAPCAGGSEHGRPDGRCSVPPPGQHEVGQQRLAHATAPAPGTAHEDRVQLACFADQAG